MANSLNNLLLNPKTRLQIDQFVANPPQALLLVGQTGSGKTVLAHSIASAILTIDDLQKYPYFIQISRPEGKNEIPIEDVRTMLRKLRLKTPGTKGIRLVIYIEDAHYLSEEAQNVLLKSLEEPSSEVLYIMGAESKDSLLPTIISRTQTLTVHPVSKQAATDYFKAHQESAVNSAWQLSTGNVGLMCALLDESLEHPLKAAVGQTKEFLRASAYDRLIKLNKDYKNKDDFLLLLQTLARILSALHRAEINRGGVRQQKIAHSRQLIQKMLRSLDSNSSTKLIALELVFNLEV